MPMDSGVLVFEPRRAFAACTAADDPIYPVGAVAYGAHHQGDPWPRCEDGPFQPFGFRFREPLKGRVAQRESTTLTS
jgi:hypothetical protein